MKITFANHSHCEIQQCSYEMNYGFVSKMYSEIGLHIHLSAQDAKNSLATLGGVANTPAFDTNFGTPVKAIVQAFTSFITPNSEKIVRNGDGTIDIGIFPHALQMGSTNAFDPNPLFSTYQRVKQQILQLNPAAPASSTVTGPNPIHAGTQSVCLHFNAQPYNPNISTDTNAIGQATVSGVFQCVFPGTQIPTYSSNVADFAAFVLAEVNRNSNPGLHSNYPKTPGAMWLTSAEAQSALRNLQQNASRYQGICNQVGGQWKAVAESLCTNWPKWPSAAPGYTPGRHSAQSTNPTSAARPA